MRSTIQTIWQSVSLPNVREQLTKMGFEIVANTPEQYAVFLREENVKWGKVVKDLGLRAEQLFDRSGLDLTAYFIRVAAGRWPDRN